jgi:MFS family permease
MSSRDDDSRNTVPPTAFPLAASVTDVADERPETTSQELPKVNARYIWFMVLAQFGVFVAFITPLAISLSIRVQELAPGHEEYLGYITGTGAFAVMLIGPIAGVLSDRTRTKIGRRRPWMIGGTILGVLSLFVMALAPDVLVLGLGWILAQMGWGQVLGNLQISTADRLPESQRGKVAGLAGFATQVAPVFGVVIAGSFSQQNLLLFLVPGIVGVVLVALFVLFVHEDDSRSLQFTEKLSLKAMGKKYIYNPKQYPDYSWNWAGRFLFYFGLTLNTTFTAFFFASKLGVEVNEVAPLIATIGGAGILATTVGALGGGFLSDRLRRRRVFVLTAAVLFAGGAALMAFAPDIPLLIAGSLLTSVGVGAFAAVDQALLLDVLPERDTDAGRFMSITGFATSIPQAFAPFIAPLILAIGASGSYKNYELLYLIAGAVTVLGGLSVLRIKSVR